MMLMLKRHLYKFDRKQSHTEHIYSNCMYISVVQQPLIWHGFMFFTMVEYYLANISPPYMPLSVPPNFFKATEFFFKMCTSTMSLVLASIPLFEHTLLDSSLLKLSSGVRSVTDMGSHICLFLSIFSIP